MDRGRVEALTEPPTWIAEEAAAMDKDERHEPDSVRDVWTRFEVEEAIHDAEERWCEVATWIYDRKNWQFSELERRAMALGGAYVLQVGDDH